MLHTRDGVTPGVLGSALLVMSIVACSPEVPPSNGQTGGAATGGSATSTGGVKPTGGNASGGRSATGGTGAVPTGLPASCGSTSCNAAATVNPKLTSYGALGNVTMYSTGASSGGACLYGKTNILYYAAINVNLAPGDGLGQWQGGRICGQCFEVTVLTSQGLKQVVVRITDKCPDGYCGMDLGGSAPAAVMVDGMGRYQGAWRAVSCAGHPEVSDGSPSLFVKDGTNPGWSVIQVRNPIMAVAAIDWQNHNNASSRGTMALTTPSIENYFSVPTEVLQAYATFDLTVRYTDGSTATASLTSAQLAQPEASYPLN